MGSGEDGQFLLLLGVPAAGCRFRLPVRGGEVAVEIDASSVSPRSENGAVGIGAKDRGDAGRDAFRGKGAVGPGKRDGGVGLLPVDSGDEESFASLSRRKKLQIPSAVGISVTQQG